jgi:serine/threonine-protein kinase
MRQAASGMQHALERNLVHRDINPSNLMLTWVSPSGAPQASRATEEKIKVDWGAQAPLIKILDMGLARFQVPGENSRSSSESGALLGTPDYMAPEQARDAQKADIRSDLYSLGCSFYHVLTGQLPFPRGTRLEKLLRHQMEEPRPVQELRPEVPRAAQAIVSKLMAKRPEQRFQTPGELAAALARVLAQAG